MNKVFPTLRRYYRAMLQRWGPQSWWPAHSRLEVIVGAFLTQNTNWTNVEKAIVNLKREQVLTVKGLRDIHIWNLEELIRPSGYFRQKARRLKGFIEFLDKQYDGSLDKMFAQPTETLRSELLSLNGIGPETADSILLYSGNHPVFVVDAYTRRILERHQVIDAKTDYEEIRGLVETAIKSAEPGELKVVGAGKDPRHPVSRMSSTERTELVQHYNELHALIVRAGSEYCKTRPKCEECPLNAYLPKITTKDTKKRKEKQKLSAAQPPARRQ